MSQVITKAFEQYWQSSLAAEQPVVLDEFVLADIPNLDITSPINPDTGLPPAGQIVYRQTVDQRGRVNSNAVAYSIVMDTKVGDFSFNAMFLRNKANGVIGMIVYKGRETKLKTDKTTGQTGNSLVKSMLMGYDQAAEATLTNVDAGTWQIDYAARLRGQDEDLRQLASQLYGHHTFIGDGFKVVQQAGGHQVTPGVAIVGGLRVELKAPEVIYPGSKPIGVWVDVHRAGSLLSEHQNHFTIITSVADLTDHVDGSGYQHFVAKLGTVQADSTVVDGRQGGNGGTSGFPHTFALWKRAMAEAGYDLVGQFGTKLTIQNTKQVLLSKDGTKVYAWLGALPMDLPANATPENVGGAGEWVDKTPDLLRSQLGAVGGSGLIGDISKPITWPGHAGGAKGDSASNTLAITAANNSGFAYAVPEGDWTNTVDASFNIYPKFRNKSGGLKLKRGLPGMGASSPFPLIWAEKTSNMQRVEGGPKWFDVAMQGALTLEATATAFGVGVSGYIRSAAGDVLTPGKSVDSIGVHGSGKAIGRNGRVWGLWGQAGNGDDGSGVRSSQLIACELNLVNAFASQPHPENLALGEGPYRGLVVTTADDGTACGIGIDVGDGSGRAATESGWWIGLRLRKAGVLPAGDWKNAYLEDTQQLKIEGSLSNLHRYGGIRLGPRYDGAGKNFTYGINMLDSIMQDGNAINLALDHRIYWGPVLGTTKWIGYEEATGMFNFRNMPIAINSSRVLSTRQVGIFQLTGTADGATKNTETVTLVDLARYVKKVTDALITHGMIGPT